MPGASNKKNFGFSFLFVVVVVVVINIMDWRESAATDLAAKGQRVKLTSFSRLCDEQPNGNGIINPTFSPDTHLDGKQILCILSYTN